MNTNTSPWRDLYSDLSNEALLALLPALEAELGRREAGDQRMRSATARNVASMEKLRETFEGDVANLEKEGGDPQLLAELRQQIEDLVIPLETRARARQEATSQGEELMLALECITRIEFAKKILRRRGLLPG